MMRLQDVCITVHDTKVVYQYAFVALNMNMKV